MQEFFRSVAEAFGRNRTEWPGAVATLVALLLVALGGVLLGRIRRRRARSARLSRLAARHGLSAADLDLARTLAAGQGIAPEELLVRLDAFERATLRALAGRSPPARGEDDAADRIRRLRRRLGFDRLPAHAPLLSTRELAPGTAVAAAGSPGQVAQVDELALAVEHSGPAPSAAGATVTLDLVHAREARYRLRCPVLAVRSSPGGTTLLLGHDEAPERVQQRAFARVALPGELTFHPLEPLPDHPQPGPGTAHLLDLSAGGALVRSDAPLPVGGLLAASFTVGDVRFEAVRAVVLASEGDRGTYRGHLEFGPMPEAERERLVAAVERAERAQLTG
jgi:c-di-GMP-binding flagellar brake protein YcgR